MVVGGVVWYLVCMSNSERNRDGQGEQSSVSSGPIRIGWRTPREVEERTAEDAAGDILTMVVGLPVSLERKRQILDTIVAQQSSTSDEAE